MPFELVVDGSVYTYSLANVDQKRTITPLDLTEAYAQHVRAQDVLPSGTGFSEVSLGNIASGSVAVITCDPAATVRINETGEIDACTFAVIAGTITKVEIEKEAADEVIYLVEVFAT